MQHRLHASTSSAHRGASVVCPSKLVPCAATRGPATLGPRPTLRQDPSPSHIAKAAHVARGTETPEEASVRRIRESDAVDDRVSWIESIDQLKDELRVAGNKLVVLELQGEGVCEAGFTETAELHWKLDQRAAEQKSLEACSRIKHTFQRTARECPDVVFLEMLVPDGQQGEVLKQELGVQVVPTIQFYRAGELLWQQNGFAGMEKEMGEGVLYYGNSAAGGEKASEFVTDITNKKELDAFVNSGDKDTLTVVNVSTTLCKPCIKVFPAVLALAKNFVGHASFGRLMGDESDVSEELMMDLNILEVPTFIFYRGGKELGRHVGSSRGDLIGNILSYQAAAGIAPPAPPPREKPVARPRAASRQKSRW